MKSKSDYVYTIFAEREYTFVSIVDNDLGGMSVTNNIDNVIKEICAIEHINPVFYCFVYMDSTGNWDGYDSDTSSFIPLRCENEIDAVNNFIEIIDKSN